MHRWPIRSAIAFLLLGAVLAHGQTSTYSSMTVAGDWQGFDAGQNNMYLISNNTWEALFFISARSTNKFKFAANGNFTTQWGKSNAVASIDPLVGTADFVGFGNDIVHVNVRDGFYRFRFNDSTRAYSVDLVSYYYTGTGGNLVRNGSFETPGTVTEEADQWQFTSRYRYGSHWGDSSRRDWRFHSPLYEAVIGTGQKFGGWWQDSPGGYGFDYEAKVWLWADTAPPFGPWTAAVTQLKIEFYGPSYGSPIAVALTNVTGLGEAWTQYSIRGAAPSNAAWARVVVGVDGEGDLGSLQIDDFTMAAIPSPSQGFDAWTFPSNSAGTYARGGWLARTSSISTTAVASLSLALAPGGSVQSPLLTGGVGRVSFSYRNASEETEGPTSAGSFSLDVSPDASSWTPQANISGILNQSFRPFSYTLNDAAQKYVRIRQTGGTNNLLVDNIAVDIPSTIVTYQTFDGWPGSANSSGCHEFGGWQLCTGHLFTAGAYEAPSAYLPGHPSFPNYLRSPLLTNGYGTMHFQYARGTNGAAPGVLRIEESANGSTWTAVGALSNIADTGWAEYSQFFFQPLARYVRILNVSTNAAAGGALQLIKEGFSGVEAPAGWTFTGISGIYESSGNYGEASPSLKLDTSNDRIVTPSLQNPTSVVFWTKGQQLSGSTLLVQGGTPTGLVTIALLTNIANTAAVNTYNGLSSTITNILFTYTKVSGNLSFDDVVVLGAPQGAQPPQDVMLDTIYFDAPQEPVRYQNFDAWPTKGEYANGTFLFEGWSISTNTIVDKDHTYNGQVLRLRDSPVAGEYVTSPFLPDGIGVLSFYYANWSTNGAPAISLQVQYSANNWASSNIITTLSVTNPSTNGFAFYSAWLNITNGVAVRLYKAGGGERVLIDEINITKPQPRADCGISGFTEPTAPFTNDPVSLVAALSPYYGATITNVAGYYRIGTSGVFTALAMQPRDFVTYTSAPPIAAQTTGTVVQYYLRVDFSGPGAEVNSPRYYPTGGSASPADYRIPRSRSGQVWINEVKYKFDFTDFLFPLDNEFIELAGTTNFNLSGWAIETYAGTNNAFAVRTAKYVIPPNTFLPPDTPTIGFWVLGHSNVVMRDMLMTNYLDALLPVGIKLLNEAGGVEQALAFDTEIPNFAKVTAVDDWYSPTTSVSLVGSGTNYSGFTWDEYISSTPGALNVGQSFGVSGLPDAWIVSIFGLTNVMIVSTGNSNNWSVAPFYFTNAVGTQTYVPVTPFFSSATAGGSNTVWFDRPAATNIFYRIRLAAP